MKVWREEGHSARVTSLLEARAERLRRLGSDDAEVPGLPVTEFSLGPERFALPLDSVEASMPLRLLTPVPYAPAHVLGVVRYRSEILTAFSLSALVGGEEPVHDSTTLLVVRLDGQRVVAVDTEDIPRPSVLPLDAIERAPRRAQGAVADVTVGDRRVSLLDLRQLIAAREAADGA